ncbi:hypothetical protein P9386_00775, partial [Caldifermentibacillus hisashii]|uniref:hypothetical protein n=1 Tax=Caldifermentibacillus hisashii TaxID=996558 RepID=UPI002E2272C0|nr:hypothetical protein [Caldifermentibacillus hisashii]
MIDIKYMPKLWVLLLFGYFLLLMILDIHQAREFISNSLFDFIVHPLSGGSAGTLTLFLGIYPVLAILIPLIVDKMENDMVVIRIRNKKELFYQHFIFSIVISAIFVIVMVLVYFAIEKCREMQLKMQRFATHLIPFRQCVGQSIA